MAQALRGRVLRAYADLLRAQRTVFQQDVQARSGALQKTRAEYRTNITVADPTKIEELLQYSAAVSEFLRKNLLQAQQKGKDNFELKIANNENKKKAYEPIVAKKPKST